jgi:hypothetical protein
MQTALQINAQDGANNCRRQLFDPAAQEIHHVPEFPPGRNRLQDLMLNVSQALSGRSC